MLPDGSTAMFYEKATIPEGPQQMLNTILDASGGHTMPGWEPEQLGEGVEKGCAVTEQAHIAGYDIGQHPDDQSRAR